MTNSFTHIGEVKASYRTTGIPFAKTTSSYEVAKFLRTIWDEDTLEYVESFCVLCLNRQNKIIAYRFIGLGGISGVVADPKLIFQTALLTNGTSIIIAHNHPSGNLSPSNADIQLTKKVVEAGKHLDLPMLDHVIITRDAYMSFADEGMV